MNDGGYCIGNEEKSVNLVRIENARDSFQDVIHQEGVLFRKPDTLNDASNFSSNP